jgi:prepilin-type N-terminal cleavage/methylation domain-containing protein
MLQASEIKARKGFTLVELAVVIVIIGVLAAFGVPRFLKSVERSKAAEAFNYLSAIRDAQERFISREGVYADNLSLLDITQSAPKYFTLPSGNAIARNVGIVGSDTSWSMQLTRDSASSSYGGYTVQFNQDGFDSNASNSNISPDINPMGISPTN